MPAYRLRDVLYECRPFIACEHDMIYSTVAMLGSLDTYSDFGRLALRLHKLLDKRMTAQGSSFARAKLLLYLERNAGPTNAASMASFFGQTSATMTSAIDALERDGMVQRERAPNDRRLKLVSITAAGKLAVRATEPIRLDILGRVFNVLSDEEIAEFTGLLSKLAQAVDDEEERQTSG